MSFINLEGLGHACEIIFLTLKKYVLVAYLNFSMKGLCFSMPNYCRSSTCGGLNQKDTIINCETLKALTKRYIYSCIYAKFELLLSQIPKQKFKKSYLLNFYFLFFMII